MNITIAGQDLRIDTVEQNGQWLAYAVRVDVGERFGLEVLAPSSEAAAERLVQWLRWQHEHNEALQALQQAERAYHRARADAAFGASASDASAERRASLLAVETARAHLDEVRGRRPLM